MTGVGFLAAAAVVAALAYAWRRGGQQRLEDDVRRLVALERARGVADPEVRALRLRVWRYLLRYPDPVPWGRYRWKAPTHDVDAAAGSG